MLDDIVFLYDKNFGRIRSLLSLYSRLVEDVDGRRPPELLDLLRATVVLLHSTLEDFLRNIVNWKLPLANTEQLNKIPIYKPDEYNKETKFGLGQLIDFKDNTITEIIEMSVKRHLNTVSFNNCGDISSWLNKVDVKLSEEMRGLFPMLDKMILRRHNIVHQADRDFEIGGDKREIKAISLQDVKDWESTVEKFVLDVVRLLR